MINNNSLLGCKYYIYDNNKPMIFRVVGFQSSDTIVLQNEETKEKFKILYKDLIDGFTKIIPDGIMCIMTVGISDKTSLQDVIVAYSTMKHISEKTGIPDIVCRQNINDIFNFVQTKNMTIVGCCATPNSMPEGVPYECMMACDSVNSELFVSTYIDDELDDILSCIRTKKIDSVLNELFEAAIKNLNKDEKEKAKKNNIYCGYVPTLKLLLESNTFMSEFYLANGILKLPFKLFGENSDPNIGVLSIGSLMKLQDICEMIFNSHSIVEYKRDINFGMLKNNSYLLLKDTTNKLYVFAYDSDSVFDPERINYALLYKDTNTKV